MEPFILLSGFFLLVVGLAISSTWMIVIGGIAVGSQLAVMMRGKSDG